MAAITVQKGIVKHCINCGESFVVPQPEKDDNNIIECGNGETNGCGAKFVCKLIE